MKLESIHEKLQRAGRPHVNLKYPVEIEGTIEEMQLPLVVGVMGDFSGDGIQDLPPFNERHFHQTTPDNFDDMIQQMKPKLNLAVTNEVGNNPDEFLSVELRLTKLADFSPIGIVRQVPELRALMERRNEYERIPNAHERLSRQLDVDERLTRQVRAIMHHEKFRRLEGSWRGLHYLVDNTEDATDLQIKVLCCSKRELSGDFAKAGDFDQSTMFEKVYLDVFEVIGGFPFSAIVGDYEIENTSSDLEMLTKISKVAATAACPFLTSPAASVFGMESWAELPLPHDLERVFAGPKHLKWNALRNSEDSRYVAMVMPRILARIPYGDSGQKVREFDFQEFDIDSKGCVKARTEVCWSNAAYQLSACITRSFAQTGFCAGIISPGKGNGSLDNLPGCDFCDEHGQILKNYPAEMSMGDDQRWSYFSRFGLLPLACYWSGREIAVFATGDMLNSPKSYDRTQASDQAKALAWLPYNLAVSRIAQYIKCYYRDELSNNPCDRQTLEDAFNRWLSEYVCESPEPREEEQLALPLRVGKIVLKEIPRQPQVIAATIWMQPWTVIRELNAPISLVTTLH